MGGAFAAWAVTDNANPLGINVTPGDISHAEIDYVTLEWGSSTKLDDLGNIKVGENRKAGVVYLKSSSTTYTGKFKISFKDDSSSEVIAAKTGEANKYLRDYLNVNVYEGALNLKDDGALPEGTVKASITKNDAAVDGVKSKEVSIVGSSDGVPLTVFVTLDVSASSTFDYIKNDNVRLTVDWAPASDSDLASDRVVYASKPAEWSDMYLYAWNSTTGVNIKNFPGVQMNQYNGDVYSLAIPADMDFVIFSAGDNVEAHQTANISLAQYTSSKQYWDGETWSGVPAEKNYYLVGKIGSSTDWLTPNTYKFGINPKNPAEYVLEGVELKANNELKIAFFDGTSAVKDTDYIPGPTSSEGNLVITKDGTYTFYFSAAEKDDWATGNSYGDQFAYAKHVWVVPESGDEPSGAIPEGKELVLSVDLGETTVNNAVTFIHYWGTGIEAGDVKVVNGQATIHKDYEQLVVVRMPAGAESIDWNGYWNKSPDLDKGTGVLTFKDWGTDNIYNFDWVAPTNP